MSAPVITVTAHALLRWRQRVDARATDDQITAILTGPAIRVAATFGARVVRTASHRIILEHRPTSVAVLTVLRTTEWLPHQLMPADRGGPMSIAHERALFLRPDLAQPQGA